jgi:3-oxoadipate enol-lactonase
MSLSFTQWGRANTTNFTVLLLHDAVFGSAMWGDTFSRCAATMATACGHAIALDLPGYGQSPADGEHSIEAMAQQVSAWLDTQVEAGRPVGLIAQGLGGMVALALLARWPARFRCAVLLGTSPTFVRGTEETVEQARDRHIGLVDNDRAIARLAPGWAQALVAPGCHQQVAAAVAVLMSGTPAARYRRSVQAMAAYDGWATLLTIKQPVLVLAAAQDSYTPPVLMKHMADRLKGSDYVCLPNVGHAAVIEDSAAVNVQAAAFLRRHLQG